MITNKILPAHILRLYVWEILDKDTSMDKVQTTRGLLVPIVPVEDEALLSNTDKPYAIYGYSESESRVIDQIREGVFSLRVNAPTYAELGQIINTVSRAFESCDVATEAVNNFSSDFPNEALIGLRFTYLKTSYVEGGEASEDEGGPMDGVVNVSYRYVNHLPIPIPDSAKGGLWS